MKQDAQVSAALLLHRLLLVCALITVRAPVAHHPILRHPTPSTPPPNQIPNQAPSSDNLADPPDLIAEISDSDRRSMSKARVYTEVNVLRPKEYWDYESLTVQWG